MPMLEAIFTYNFMQNALLAGLLASVIGGLIGTIIVEKKLVSMSGGIAHASFGGIGAGYFFGVEPIIGGLAFALISSLSVGQLKRKVGTHTDSIISMFWSAGMAVGILFVALTPGYPPDMTTYLFGDILTVNDFYLNVMFGMTLVITFLVLGLFNYWKIYLFDEEYADIMGIKILLLEFLLYSIMAVSIVILIKVVGVILSLAMLTIPPAIARQFTYKLSKIMMISVLLGVFFSMAGLTISYYVLIPSGATIILVAIVTYFLVTSVKYLTKK